MTHTVKIVSRYDSTKVLFEFVVSDEVQASGFAMRVAVEAAVAADAKLTGADLTGAKLTGADLTGAGLTGAKADFFDVLLRAPREVSGLRLALVDGRVGGSAYEGECACLVGTIANVRHAAFDGLGNGLVPDGGRPAERWFLGIAKGDTPKTSPIVKITVEWIDEFSRLMAAAIAPAEGAAT